MRAPQNKIPTKINLEFPFSSTLHIGTHLTALTVVASKASSILLRFQRFTLIHPSYSHSTVREGTTKEYTL